MREQELEQPFTERVLDPLADRFTAIGRRFTPEDRAGGSAGASTSPATRRAGTPTASWGQGRSARWSASCWASSYRPCSASAPW